MAGTLNLLGDLAKDRDDWNSAREFYKRSLLIRRKIAPTNIETSYSLYELGETDAHDGKLNSARQYYEEALAIRARVAAGSTSHAEALAGLASVMAKQGLREPALGLYEKALNALETQTERLGGARDVRIGFRSQQTQYYRDYAALLVEERRYSDALTVLERSRAETLRETLLEGHVEVRKGIDRQLLVKLHSLQEALAAKANYRISLLSSMPSPAELNRVDKELQSILLDYQQVQAQVQGSSPAYSALMQPRTVTLDDIQHRLVDGNTALIEYMLGSDRSYVFVITSSSFHVQSLPKGSDIDLAARQLGRRLRMPKGSWDTRVLNSYYDAAGKLSQMVFAPISREVVGKRLIVVPDGFLNYIPFAALLEVTPADVTPSHPRPLILNHEIVNVPSAATLSLLLGQNARRQRALKTVAVLADPVFSREDERVSPQASSTSKDRQDQSDGGEQDHRGQTGTRRDSGNARLSRIGLTRLYYSREEARRILAATPAGQGVADLGFDANREAVLNGNLKSYHIIHFATHAVVNEKRPELSGLVLTLVDKRGRAQDGFLGLEDIYNLNLPADLVVLSACNTASGKEAQGEGVIGLTHAFLYAGSSRVLASLWEVEDHAAADLMGWFYEAMEKGGMSPAAALREAQIRMWRNPNLRAPFFWAAFQLQGGN